SHVVSQPVESRADVPVARRQIPRRAAIGGDNEQMDRARLGVSALVLPVMQTVGDGRSVRPLGTFGWFRQDDVPGRGLGDKHAERDLLAVGRPPEIGWLLFAAR